MKNINFIKTGMENFCCYKDLVEYEFKNDKVFLITGPNGSGKTTIFDSIPFTLYGITTKGLKADDVVNNEEKKNCHTYTEFLIENDNIKDHYRVDRYYKHSKFGDTVTIFKNNEIVKKGHREVIAEIEKILVPQKIFTNTLLFGQKVKNFFTDLTDSEQKEIFRKVLQLDDYLLYYDETNNRIKKVNIEIDEVNRKISLNSSLIDNNEKQIEISEEDKRNYEVKKIEDIQSLNNEIFSLNIRLNELSKNLELYKDISNDELIKVNEKISQIQNEINKINSEKNHSVNTLVEAKISKENEINQKTKELISEKNLEKTKLISEYNSNFQEKILNFQTKFMELDKQKKVTELELEQIQKVFVENSNRITLLSSSINQSSSVCPTCGKELTDESLKNHLVNELDNLKKENEKIPTKKDNLKEEINSLISLILENKNLENNERKLQRDFISENENNYQNYTNEIKLKQISALEKLSSSFDEKKKLIEQDFEDKQKNYKNSLETEIGNKSKISSLILEKSNIEKDITQLKSEIDLKEILIKQKEKEEYNNSILNNLLKEKEKLIIEKEKLIIEKESVLNHLDILNFWKSGFSTTGIPSLLIDESIPFLNVKVSDYLQMIGGRYVVSFDTISSTKAGEYRDKINVNVLDTITKANHRKQLSGGQTRIVDIAILLSLCDLQNKIQDMSTNILLLDEVFDSLDDENISYVSSLLRTLIKGKSINIISHRHIDSIESDEIIRLF